MLNFSKSTLWWIIASMLQAAIWWACYSHSGNNSALSYVSFAGTIISIILAIFSIFYTYTESIRSQQSSINLTNSINSLAQFISRLEIATKNIEKLDNNVESIKSTQGEINEAIGRFINTNSSAEAKISKDSPPTHNGVTITEIHKFIELFAGIRNHIGYIKLYLLIQLSHISDFNKDSVELLNKISTEVVELESDTTKRIETSLTIASIISM